MTKRRIFSAAFLSLALLVSSCSAQGGQPTPTPIPAPVVPQKPTYRVQRGTVARVLSLQGRVSPIKHQDLFFRSDGTLRTVNFSLGDRVKAGDVLAELDLGDLDIQLSQAQLALQQAETKFAQAEQDNADEIIEAQIELEKVNLQARQAGALGIDPSIQAQKEFDQNLERVRETLQAALLEYHESANQPELTAEEREAIRQKLEQAREDYINTWLEYAEIVAGPANPSTDAQIMAKDLALARLRVEELKSGLDPMMYLDVEKRRLDLQNVQKKVEQARLIAPFDGQILSLSLTPGSQVLAFQPVLTLADPSALDITVRPSSDDLTVLNIGQAASVEWMNRPGQVDSGHIRLMSYAENTSNSNDQDQDQAVHIDLDDANRPLTIGEAATVVIEVEKRENVLWLPPAALRTFQGRDFVFTQENKVQRRIDVRLGLRSADRVEILEGLKEGQTVVGP